MNNIKLYTIGFTQKSAEQFFGLLHKAGVTKIIDARLNNTSQLSGFTKKDDLKYFLIIIDNIEYIHMPILAPTEEILTWYNKKKLNWQNYEKNFIKLLEERHIENVLNPAELDNACILCSEHLPDYCHRRLVAEYLKNKWHNVILKHLVS